MSQPSATGPSYGRGATYASGLALAGTNEPSTAAVRRVVRTFTGLPPQGISVGRASVPTAVSENALFPIGQNRAAQTLAREISSYRSLREGWDGEGALSPNDDAICDAARFVYAAGRIPGLVSRLETSLNTDGTVALDVEDGIGTLMFRGDDSIVHAFEGHAPGVVDFYDDAIPSELLRTLLG